MRDLELLSALLDGDLPIAEADALRQRIGSEPELERAWQSMRALPSSLAALPTEHHGAPPVDAQGAARHRGPPVAALALLMAAAAALMLLPASPQPTVTLGMGHHELSGEMIAHVGQATIHLDGVAELTLEPAEGLARARGQEVYMNPSTTVAAAIAGAALTVAVYEGSAIILAAPDADAITLTAGQSHSLSAGTAAMSHAAPAFKRPDGTAIEALPTASRDYVESLERAVAEAQFEAQLTRGQLAHLGGEPIPWPDDLPTSLRPDAFEARVEGALEGVDGATLLDVDCEEYPCVAYIDVASGGQDSWRPVTDALTDSIGEEDMGMMVMGMEHADDDGSSSAVLAVALLDKAQEHPGVDTRINQRAREYLEDMAPEKELP